MPGVLAQLVAEHSGHTDHEEHISCALTAARYVENIIANSSTIPGLPEAQKLGELYDEFCLH
eukprot:11028843-Karenia_brevis.AAC.1